jgi:fructokinase
MSRAARQRSRPVIFGEVLFDRFPDGSVVLGGAPFNVAWNLQALGQAPLVISRVGRDALGDRVLESMSGWGMDTSGLQRDAAHATGTVDVRFENGEPHYDIVADRAYDFLERVDLKSVEEAAMIYHGSLALRSPANRATLKNLLAQGSAPRFVDVNLRTPWWRRESVLDMLRGAEWVKLNEDELALLDPKERMSDDAGQQLRRRLALRGLILTRGKRGAVLLTDDTRAEVAPEGATRVVDTVGAGDAFASIVVLGLLRRWPLRTTLERAQQFSSAVVGIRGATVNDSGFYAAFREAWSHDDSRPA